MAPIHSFALNEMLQQDGRSRTDPIFFNLIVSQKIKKEGRHPLLREILDPTLVVYPYILVTSLTCIEFVTLQCFTGKEPLKPTLFRWSKRERGAPSSAATPRNPKLVALNGSKIQIDCDIPACLFISIKIVIFISD